MDNKEGGIESVVQWIQDKFVEDNKEELTKAIADTFINGQGAIRFEIDDNNTISCKAVDLRGDG